LAGEEQCYEPIYPIIRFSYGFDSVCGRRCSRWLSIRCKQETMLLHADFAIFTLALKDGEVFYLPEKLTYYRIGAGHSQTTTCNDLPKVVCTWNKYTHDDDVLSRYIDIKEINKIINYSYISHLVKIYIYSILSFTVFLSIKFPIFCLLKDHLRQLPNGYTR
jgi:hypothetical protein